MQHKLVLILGRFAYEIQDGPEAIAISIAVMLIFSIWLNMTMMVMIMIRITMRNITILAETNATIMVIVKTYDENDDNGS